MSQVDVTIITQLARRLEMGDPFVLETARERQEELLREAEERRISGALRRARRSAGHGRRGPLLRMLRR